VDVLDSGNLKQLTGNQKAKSVNCNYGCRGVVFRTILRQEMDFSGYLNSFSLETDRKSRDAGDTKLLFCPKPETEKSIGVLRIVKPKRFTSRSAAASYLEGSGQVAKISLDPTSRADTVREFEILLESTDFILEDVQEQMAERFQLQETFGDFNVFFFGRRAEIFTYSGTLVNAGEDLAWRNNFLYNYENYLRGTKCAELKARAYLLYDDVVREGFILSAAVSQNSTVEAAVKFTFTLLVTGKRILTAAPENVAKSDFVEVTDVKSITPEDFEFVRSNRTDGGLSWVSPPVTGGAEEISVSNCFMMENTAIEGAVPASDLQQAIINRSLEAIKAAKSEELTSESDQVLDYEVLIDFVTAKQLAGLATTSQQIAGLKSSDVENLSGEVIVAQLLSGATTVDNLRLRDAMKAADSMAKQYDSTLGGEAGKLKDLAQYFAPNGQLRIPSKLGPDVNFQQSVAAPQGLSDKRYVLSADLDSQLITTILSKTASVESFNQGVTDKQAVDLSKVLMLDALGTKGYSKEIQSYAAAFCLIESAKNPGQLIGNISTKFPGARGYGGKGNALTFVKDQTLESLQGLMATLPAAVASEVMDAISALEASPLYALAKSKAKGTPIPIGDGILYQASLNPGGVSKHVVRFLSQIGVYVTGIVQETYRNSPSTTDLLGGTLKGGSLNLGEKYFTDAYAATVSPTTDPRFGTGVVQFVLPDSSKAFSDFPTSEDDDGGLYVFAPHGRSARRFVVSGLGRPIVVDLSSMDGDDRTLFLAGMIHIKKSVRDESKLFQPTRHYMEVERRVDVPSVPGCIEVVQGSYEITGGTVGSAIGLRQFMPKRVYGGGSPKAYIYPIASTLTSVVGTMATSIGEWTNSAISFARSKIAEIVANPEALDKPPYFDNKEVILSGLAVSNYSSVPTISNVDLDLRYMGVVADNYLNLAYMANVQKEAVKKLSSLKSKLDTAVTRLRAGETESAATVRGADGQEQEVSCG